MKKGLRFLFIQKSSNINLSTDYFGFITAFEKEYLVNMNYHYLQNTKLKDFYIKFSQGISAEVWTLPKEGGEIKPMSK